ncbi:hypothetical protein QTI24_02845 [Variovorax sp. J22P240]|uniref:hypothetical protein n=1 Tax=unclassified Variovorax TaxID=663243 RepID=UPI0025787A19|nr:MULTISPECIES: hypothetical protein [unclassified Variovorax]MDL9997525.1 hypothetical protein [Variovorax sp. J22P240]MDM0051561.1 hypothetical protein [Variovorax sp. J22R115]
MTAGSRALAALGAFIATAVHAGEGEATPAWEFAATAYPTIVRGGGNYTSAVMVAQRAALHLEARVNYESVGARSAFIGWTFAGGEELTWELTPLLGSAWGTTKAFVPGMEASLGWRRFDFYVEAEYVRFREESSRYLYAWSELGYRPVEWLRVGLAAQRTRAYGGDRDVLRGPFAQVTWRQVTVGGFWFNPGSKDQVFVASISAVF